MAGYWVVRTSDIADEEAYQEYSRHWAPIAEKYGASFLVGPQGRHEAREGPDFPRVLVVEFPSYEQAVACYDDPDYQESLPFSRICFTERDLVIVESE